MTLAIKLIQLLGLLACVLASNFGRISLKDRSSGARAFIDSHGREVFFHGVNAVVKGPPWIPSTEKWDGEISLTDKDFDDLQSLGLNVIRLGTMWPGVEPTQGAYSKEYIRKVKGIASRAAARGIYTLLDMHQDVISENYCGEGVPDWLIKMADIKPLHTFPEPHNGNVSYTAVASDGFPTRQDCAKSNWPEYYGTYETSAAFEALYTQEGLLSAWSEFWKTLAVEFKDDAHILGYELINEPWAGDVFTNHKLLIPGVADNTKLQPAYDKLAAAIRGVDQTTLIFFAAITWDDIVKAGFTQAPMNSPANSVFAYHYYEPPQLDQFTYFRTRTQDAERLNVGSMLTEFERPRNDNDMVSDPVFKTFDAADQHLQSWAMWELKTFCKETDSSLNGDSQNAAYGSCKTGYGEQNYLWDSNGVLNTNTTMKMARTYAQAVAGTAQHMKFDHQTAAFEFRYEMDATIKEPTLVFAHKELQYPTGYTISVSPEHLVTYRESATQKNVLEFHAVDVKEVRPRQSVTIKIARAQIKSTQVLRHIQNKIWTI